MEGAIKVIGFLLVVIIGQKDNGVPKTLWRMKFFLDLSMILHYERTRHINEFLGIAIGLSDLELIRIIAHFLFEVGETADVRSRKAINGLPIISDSKNFGIRGFRHLFAEIEPLKRDVLIFIDKNVIERGFLPIFDIVIQNIDRPVDHILEIDEILCLQRSL